MSTLPTVFASTLPEPQQDRRQNDQQERSEARAREPFRADRRHAGKGDGGADDLDAARAFA